MKISVIIILLLTLSACNKRGDSPLGKISLQGMTKEVAVAYSKSPNLNKISHDRLWLSTGGVVNIVPGLINPDPKFIVSNFDDKGREALIARDGGFEIHIDRGRGKICTLSECADIFYICQKDKAQDLCNYYR